MCLNLYQSRQNKLQKSIQNKTKQKTFLVFINSILPHIFLLFYLILTGSLFILFNKEACWYTIIFHLLLLLFAQFL